MTDPELRSEAQLFARYLVGSTIDEATVDRYVRGCRTLGRDRDDSPVVRFATRHPWSLAMLDAAVARVPTEPLRAKLLLLFAIIEAQPAFAGRFLPTQRSRVYGAVVLFCGLRAVARLALGLLLRAAIR